MHGAGAEVSPVDVWLAVATIFLCVALSAFFAASETALTAASSARMHGLEKNGDRRAALVNRLLTSRERLIGTTLLGNTLVNIGASAFTTSVLVALAGDHGAIYATGLMTMILLRFRRSDAENRGNQLSRPHIAAGRACDLLFRRHFRAGPHHCRSVRALVFETCRRRYEPPAFDFVRAMKS